MFKSSLATVALFVFAVGTAGATTFGNITLRQAERDARQAIGGGGRVQSAQQSQTRCGIPIWVVVLNKDRFQYTVYLYAANGEVEDITKTPR